MSVVVVGSVNLDVVLAVPRIPGPGETLLADSIARGGGGKGANQAVAAARAGGADVAFVGCVGDDADGRWLLGELAGDGIDTAGVVLTVEPTGMAFIAVDTAGENSIVVVAGANGITDELAPHQLAIIAGAAVVIAQLEIPVERVIVAARARAPGARFLLNAAPAEPLTDPAIADRLLPLVDLLVVNEHELVAIAGALAPDGADSTEASITALSARVPALVVTLGAAGAIVAVGAQRRSVASFEVETVDTTGAGDTYCGVLAAEIDRNGGALSIDAIAAAARMAAAAAAIAVGRPGAQSAVPTAAEVAGLLAGA